MAPLNPIYDIDSALDKSGSNYISLLTTNNINNGGDCGPIEYGGNLWIVAGIRLKPAGDSYYHFYYRVYKSTDNGQTWILDSTSNPITIPADRGTIYNDPRPVESYTIFKTDTFHIFDTSVWLDTFYYHTNKIQHWSYSLSTHNWTEHNQITAPANIYSWPPQFSGVIYTNDSDITFAFSCQDSIILGLSTVGIGKWNGSTWDNYTYAEDVSQDGATPGIFFPNMFAQSAQSHVMYKDSLGKIHVIYSIRDYDKYSVGTGNWKVRYKTYSSSNGTWAYIEDIILPLSGPFYTPDLWKLYTFSNVVELNGSIYMYAALRQMPNGYFYPSVIKINNISGIPSISIKFLSNDNITYSFKSLVTIHNNELYIVRNAKNSKYNGTKLILEHSTNGNVWDIPIVIENEETNPAFSPSILSFGGMTGKFKSNGHLGIYCEMSSPKYVYIDYFPTITGTIGNIAFTGSYAVR